MEWRWEIDVAGATLRCLGEAVVHHDALVSRLFALKNLPDPARISLSTWSTPPPVTRLPPPSWPRPRQCYDHDQPAATRVREGLRSTDISTRSPLGARRSAHQPAPARRPTGVRTEAVMRTLSPPRSLRRFLAVGAVSPASRRQRRDSRRPVATPRPRRSNDACVDATTVDRSSRVASVLLPFARPMCDPASWPAPVGTFLVVGRRVWPTTGGSRCRA